MKRADDCVVVGNCGFNGPPDGAGVVEIAYGVKPAFQRNGYATEAAGAILAFALSNPRVVLVCAYTLPDAKASCRVLTRCGFRNVGEHVHAEDGLVWRWERGRDGDQDREAEPRV